MRKVLIIFLLFHFVINGMAQHEKKYLQSVRIEEIPEIDGKLDEEVWKKLPVARDFVMLRPKNGQDSEDSTMAMVVYSNDAIYIGAMLYQNPDEIQTAITKRDVYESNADKFGVFLAPFNDGINGYEFWVTAASIQLDFKKVSTGSDDTFDEVWQSAVSICDSGWMVEMRIPYSALRFPRMEEQNWGLNFLRVVRNKQYLSTWNFVNRAIPGIANQSGELTEIKNIKPPLRMSFTPYVSGYVEKNTGHDLLYGYRGGLDLKYGINESFTLDMMLIPDFGQVQSDDVVLNLTPYEVQYEERRQFFVEGNELFSRGNVFYSKRIGAKPVKYGDAEGQLDSNEVLVNNPDKTQLINATKISGRTDRGLGIGVLNAITSNTYAGIDDTTIVEDPDLDYDRRYMTQPLTNYNVLVFDQSLKNNSYASLINTNMFRDDRNANVTAFDMALRDKKSMYQVRTIGGLSRIEDQSQLNPDYGHRTYLQLAKISGNYRANLSRSLRSASYDYNDLGFMSRNNIVMYDLNMLLYDYDDWWHVIKSRFGLEVDYDMFYKIKNNKNVFTQLLVEWNYFLQFRNYSEFMITTRVRPTEQEDYDETRVDGRVFKDRTYYVEGIAYETDPRKKWNISGAVNVWQTFKDKDACGYSLNVNPKLSVGNKLSLELLVGHSMNINNLGYVSKTDNEDTIYFGNRDIKVWATTFSSSYSFDEKSTLSLRVRHYWSEVLYDKYFSLNQTGYLDPINNYSDIHDKNFNVFNLDLVYTWRFAPGSVLSLVWKNAIISDKNDEFFDNYFEDFVETLNESQMNNISLRILYYLDYAQIKRAITKY